MTRLAASSFGAVAANLGGPVPLFLGLPHLTPAGSPWLMRVPEYLQKLTGIAVDREALLQLDGEFAERIAAEETKAFAAADAGALALRAGNGLVVRNSLLRAYGARVEIVQAPHRRSIGIAQVERVEVEFHQRQRRN